MIKFFILFSIFLSKNCIASSDTIHCAKIEEISDLKLLTWNVQMLPKLGRIFNKKQNELNPYRTEWILEHIDSLNCDIILLQECFSHDFLNDISKKFCDKYPYQILPKKNGIFKTSNGLIILSKYKVLETKSIFFLEAKNIDKFASKGAVMATITINDTSVFKLINTHLQSDYKKEFSSIRTKQLNQIKNELICQDPISPCFTFLAGDLNISEDTVNQEYLSMIETLQMKDLIKNEYNFPIFSYDKNNYWNSSVKSSSRLDYIFTNSHLRQFSSSILKPFKIYRNKKIDLADHYGIIAEFNLSR